MVKNQKKYKFNHKILLALITLFTASGCVQDKSKTATFSNISSEKTNDDYDLFTNKNTSLDNIFLKPLAKGQYQIPPESLGQTNPEKNNAQVSLLKGMNHNARGEYEQAKSTLERALNQTKYAQFLLRAKIRAELGGVYTQLGNETAAFNEYTLGIIDLKSVEIHSSWEQEKIKILILTELYERNGILHLSQLEKNAALDDFITGHTLVSSAEKLGYNEPSFLYVRAGLMTRIGDTHFQLGEVARSKSNYKHALSIAQNLVDEYPNEIKYRKVLSNAHRNIARIKIHNNEIEAGLPHLQSSYNITKELALASPTEDDRQMDLSVSMEALGFAYEQTNGLDQALKIHSEVLEIRKKLLEKQPNDQGRKHALAFSYERLGYVYLNKDKPIESYINFEASRLIFKNLSRQNSSNLEWIASLAAKQTIVAGLLELQGRKQEALHMFIEGRALIRPLAKTKADPRWKEYVKEVDREIVRLSTSS